MGKCKNCKWWSKEREWDWLSLGYCEKVECSWMRDIMEDRDKRDYFKDDSLIYCNPAATVVTGGNFGCIHFERKGS